MLEKVLKKIMEERSLTISELSRRSNVPKSNISSWLSGSKPSLEQLDKVATYLGVSIEYLAFGRKRSGYGETTRSLTELELQAGKYEISIRRLDTE